MKCILLAVAVAVAVFAAGCQTRTFRSPAEVPSDQRTPIALNSETVQLLTDAGVVDARILAEALSAVQDQGSVIYVDHQGFVYDPTGVPFLLANGQPLRVRTTIIAKLNSIQAIQEMEGVDTVDYEVGGRSYLTDLPDSLKHMDTCPVPLRLRINGVSGVKTTVASAEVIKARAAERDAILARLPDLVREQYVGTGKVIEALGDGLVKVITAAGDAVIGRLISVTPTGAAAESVKVLLETDSGVVKEVIAKIGN